MSEQSIIQLENISVFQKNILILSQVNLRIEKGEFVYLIGKTGSGKSSLLKLLYAELPVKEGQATVAGYHLNTIKNKHIPHLRRKLGIIFQDFQLLMDRSVEDNLKFILKSTGWKEKQKIKDRIQEVLNLVGLGTKGFKMPHQLSGGEQQRVGIARALLNNPTLILADEPTGNLDPQTSEGILELLFEINRGGTTVLMATHDYSLFERFPARTVVCENSTLTENIKDTTAPEAF